MGRLGKVSTLLQFCLKWLLEPKSPLSFRVFSKGPLTFVFFPLVGTGIPVPLSHLPTNFRCTNNVGDQKKCCLLVRDRIGNRLEVGSTWRKRERRTTVTGPLTSSRSVGCGLVVHVTDSVLYKGLECFVWWEFLIQRSTHPFHSSPRQDLRPTFDLILSDTCP